MEHPIQPQRFPWRLFWLLFALGILGMVSSIPIAIDLFGAVITAEPLPLPLPLVILLGAVQNFGLLALMVFLGLKLGQRVGLGAPLLEGWLNGNSVTNQWRASLGVSFREGIIAGIGIGVVLLIALIAVAPRLPNLPFVTAGRLAVWKRLLACLYGGLYEEILCRLFLLTLIAWLANKALRKSNERLSLTAFWISNLVVAVLFGLGHLPSASLVMPITPLVVALALIFNGIAAISFGVLFRKRGLEAAMIAHFTTDFVIYVVGPRFLVT
ncbi:MAG: CPBP family intramembrane metalloprotease [Pyrinomonadaceae bacterium]|nr:CPBP family intramembrane metalloprotease [Pyrinomonadaceae bacterium]